MFNSNSSTKRHSLNNSLFSMDIFTQFSDPTPVRTHNSFSSSISESGTVTSPPQLANSDEEVTCHSLATNKPKKRAGRQVFKETRHPVYRGVRRRNGDKWVCEMREPNTKKTRIWLGTYPTPEMAARAHDVAALAYRGKLACLNFADSAWRLPIPGSLDAKEVRRVATEAAHMFHPNVEAPNEASNSENNGNNNNVFNMDEEELLDMPRLLNDMAQGLLLSPPNFLDESSNNWESDAEFSLWSY